MILAFDIIIMVNDMDEYLILVIILSSLLIIYTIYIVIDENKYRTEWENTCKLLKKQKRTIIFKKIKLFFMEMFR